MQCDAFFKMLYILYLEVAKGVKPSLTLSALQPRLFIQIANVTTLFYVQIHLLMIVCAFMNIKYENIM